MADKPDMRRAWANSGSSVAPAGAKIDNGWIAEKPPFQSENWIQNRSDTWIQSVEETGVPEWDVNVPYLEGAHCHTAVDVYKAVQANQGQNPVLNTAYWRIVDNIDDGLALQNQYRGARLSVDIDTELSSGLYHGTDGGFGLFTMTVVNADNTGMVSQSLVDTAGDAYTRYTTDNGVAWSSWLLMANETTNIVKNSSFSLDVASSPSGTFDIIQSGMVRAKVSLSANGDVNLVRLSSGGAIEATLTLKSDGNVSIDAANPNASNDLVRRDYVKSEQDFLRTGSRLDIFNVRTS